MSHTPGLRFLLNLFIIIVLVYSSWLFSQIADSRGSRQRNNQAADREKSFIPVVPRQLDAVDGVTPVELKCDATALVLRNTLEQIPCTIKNNSNSVIRALVLGTSVSVDKQGKLSTESGYIAIDTLVHPDLHKTSKSRGLTQKSESKFPFASEGYDGIITHLQVHIDYVEFADKQTIGPNRRGAEIVADIRAGASKYKEWLVKDFQSKGRSAATLIRLLGGEEMLPVDLGINGGNQEQGALIYRNQLREIYRTEGAEGLMKEWSYRNSNDNH